MVLPTAHAACRRSPANLLDCARCTCRHCPFKRCKYRSNVVCFMWGGSHGEGFPGSPVTLGARHACRVPLRMPFVSKEPAIASLGSCTLNFASHQNTSMRMSTYVILSLWIYCPLA